MSLEDRIDGALLRSAADAADLIREALVAGLNPTAIAEAFLATHPKEVTPAAARAWARHNVRFNPAPLEAALRQIYGTGWTLGVDSARSHLAQRTFKKAAGPNLNDYVGFDWNNWKPGNHPGEYLVRPPGGLRALLERRGQAISSIASTNYDRVGTILADALRGGDTAASVAREFITSNIDRLAADPARALTIATTEMARAMMVASVDQYGEFGVEQVEWLGMDPCEEICAPLDGQRVPLGQAFDSGDTEPPAHPNCRCTLVPVVDDGADLPVVPLEDNSLDSGMEDFADSSHAIDDIAPAAFPTIDYDSMTRSEIETTVVEHFDKFKHGDFTLADINPRFSRGGNELSYSASVMSNGKKAGTLTRIIDLNEKTAKHDFLYLSPDYRNKGFATAFNNYSNDYYRALGVERITVFAAMDNGGYTWARAGFTWDDYEYAFGVPGEVITSIERYYWRDPEVAGPEIKSILDRFAGHNKYSNQWATPAEIAMAKNAKGESVGKELLVGTRWFGMKDVPK